MLATKLQQVQSTKLLNCVFSFILTFILLKSVATLFLVNTASNHFEKIEKGQKSDNHLPPPCSVVITLLQQGFAASEKILVEPAAELR